LRISTPCLKQCPSSEEGHCLKDVRSSISLLDGSANAFGFRRDGMVLVWLWIQHRLIASETFVTPLALNEVGDGLTY